MKQRFIDRLLSALCGAWLFLVAMVVFLWCIGFVPHIWAPYIPEVVLDTAAHIILIGASSLAMLLGAYCFALPFKRGRAAKGFVVQKTDNGQMSISIRAMENLVQRCIDQHAELHIVGSHITANREGVVVNLRVGLANGVSIPLAVNALQKQIKQYIQACSGVDVKEVRVQVETASAKATDSPFMVHDVLMKADENEYVSEYVSETDQAYATQPPADAQDDHHKKAPENESVPDETRKKAESKGRKPLHQRLFGHDDQAAAVQGPPANVPPQEDRPAESEQELVEAPEEETEHEEP